MIQLDERDIERVMKEMESIPEKVPNVLYRTLNDSMKTGISKAGSAAIKIYDMRKRTIDNRVKIRKASPDNLSTTTHVRSPSLIVARYGLNVPSRTKAGNMTKLSLRVLRGSRRSVLKHGFVVMKNDTPIVGEHKDGTVKWMYGPSVPQVMGRDEVVEAFHKASEEQMKKRLEHYVDKYLLGAIK